jgi:hypothetical protein
MFDAWHDFYLLTGPSAAALIGWLFVIATLTSGFDHEKVVRGTRVYSTPTVFHLAVVVLLSALALMPHVPTGVFAGVIIASAAIGLLYSGFVGLQLRSGRLDGHWADFWYYAVAVGVAYAAVLTAGALVNMECPAAPWTLGGSLLALLLLAVHNSWDLVTWMAPRLRNPGN